ncbi:hypothetical protein ASPZODRAFT_34478, partial [Penicilliopsis zonata CBS 506.65]
LQLPAEIHLLIADCLTFPDVLCLKHACVYLYDLVPPLTHAELLVAESSSLARQKNLYACRYCLRLLPASRFADRMLHSRRDRSGRDAGRRFCIRCGLQPRDTGAARYGPGAQIVVDGVFKVFCLHCKGFR